MTAAPHADRTTASPAARVVAVQDDLVTIALERGSDDARPELMKNEVVYISPERDAGTDDAPIRLKAEVLRVRGDEADAQVFESTLGVAVGDPVELSGALMSVTLGPGLLGRVFDGLQTPLHDLAARSGVFLPWGASVPALDENAKWSFTPRVKSGDVVRAGDVLGETPEGRVRHKIMTPFDWRGRHTVVWIQEGAFRLHDPVARLRDGEGRVHDVTLAQRWPVRRSLAGDLGRRGVGRRLYPDTPIITKQRLVDSFFPIAKGGTACIPGPFGAGKTVLQNLIARHSLVDVVVIVACGERAGEVVETIQEFPRMRDPSGEASLMDRTVIVCNTSSMPVAAREASIYTGVTIGEYYRQMGCDVLLIADSTSRWAQAMRETSGRLEEIPGEEGYPAYLESTIKGVYERAGVVEAPDGGVGSLTMIGTVSPAGGNFDEPVTQATLGTVKCFLGLSSERAYKRFYPAVDPLLSWSRYREQLRRWYEDRLDPDWTGRILALQDLLRRGEDVRQMMQVTGEDGVSLGDFVTFQKALFVDMAFLQQDAFDAVDAAAPLERQKELLLRIHHVVTHERQFADADAARAHFTRLTALFKEWNYAAEGSPDQERVRQEIDAALEIRSSAKA